MMHGSFILTLTHNDKGNFQVKYLGTISIFYYLLVCAGAPVWAQQSLSEEDFLNALAGPQSAQQTNTIRKGKTRGLSFDGPSNKGGSQAEEVYLTPNQKKLINRLAIGKSRGIGFSVEKKIKKTPEIVKDSPVETTSAERLELRKIVKENKLPSIDVELTFAYDSAVLTAKAKRNLNKLGLALINKRLAHARIMLSGHTDAKGGADYNLALSERRAKSAKLYLIDRFGIQPSRLIAVGNGEEELKFPSNPNGAGNRRVQIVNMSR